MNASTTPLTDDLHSAVHWWKLAGVDQDFADDATDWLADASPVEGLAATKSGIGKGEKPTPKASAEQSEEISKEPIKRLDLLGETPPATLDEFREWWLEAPGLDTIGPRGRVAARGEAGAKLMVLVVDPEQGDTDQLLSGPQGRLLARMLSAMGVSEDEAYIASTLPRHTPMADTINLAASGMDTVTLHHVGLVSPQRLLCLGKGVLPMLGQNVSDTSVYLREINQDAPEIRLLKCEGLESLMTMPRLKARFWRRWIEWSSDWL